MRASLPISVALLAAFALAAPGVALEKSVERVGLSERGGWVSSDGDSCGTGAPCSIAYYNICTGYIWIWSGWRKDSTVGTVFDSCTETWEENLLAGSYFYYRTGAVPGYGFTGTATVHAVDASLCPVDPPLATRSILPAAGWNLTLWNLYVPDRYAVVHTIADDLDFGSPVTVATDGPMACGDCYPTTRTTRSYSWGWAASPLCPGSPMFDGDCFVEFLAVAHQGNLPTSIEGSSWGALKALYR